MIKKLLSPFILVLSIVWGANTGAATLHISRTVRGNWGIRLSNESTNRFLIERIFNFQPADALAFGTAPTAVFQDNESDFFRARTLEALALSYCEKAGLTNLNVFRAYSDWVTGLKGMGLLTKAVYLASLRPGQVPTNTIALEPLKGPRAFYRGTPIWEDPGLRFDGSMFMAMVDPFARSNLEEITIFAVFRSDRTTPGLLVGNDAGDTKAGPALWVGGSPYQGVDPHNLHFNVTDNGTVWGNPGYRYYKTFNSGNTGGFQFGLVTANLTNVYLQVDEDRGYQAGSDAPRIIANPGGEWRIGARYNGSWKYTGSLSFIAVFDQRLSSEQFRQLRVLYRRTLGEGVPFPKGYLVIEGDSFSSEAFGWEYGHFLPRQPNWAGKYFKKNIAFSGEGTIHLLEQFAQEALPLPPGPAYLFVWAGRNDLPSSTADQILGRLREYWRMARNAGYKLGVFTIVPAAYDKDFPEIERNRDLLNEQIRAHSSEYDFLVDVAGMPSLTDPTNLEYYQPDGVHLTAKAGEEIAVFINATIPPPQ